MSERKQYINRDNYAPSAMLWEPWMLSLTIYVLKWPEWLHYLSALIAVLLFINFAVRKSNEDGINVVKR